MKIIILTMLLVLATGCYGEPGNSNNKILTWDRPTERESLRPLPVKEISGYIIRYRKTANDAYQFIEINSGNAEQYNLKKVLNSELYTFEIAAIDEAGLVGTYSSGFTPNY